MPVAVISGKEMFFDTGIGGSLTKAALTFGFWWEVDDFITGKNIKNTERHNNAEILRIGLNLGKICFCIFFILLLHYTCGRITMRPYMRNIWADTEVCPYGAWSEMTFLIFALAMWVLTKRSQFLFGFLAVFDFWTSTISPLLRGWSRELILPFTLTVWIK